MNDVIVEGGEQTTQVADSQTEVANLLYADSETAANEQANSQQQVTEGESQGEKPAAEGAPEKYEFVEPEGAALDKSVLSAYEGVARELGLSQDKAQMVIDKIAPMLAKQQAGALEAVGEAWTTQSQTDAEFGGDKLDASLATAKMAMDRFASPEFIQLLKVSQLGNNPEVIRTFYRMGKAMSQDRVVTGRAAPPQSADLAERLYGKNH